MKIFQFSFKIWFWALMLVLGAGGLTATTITFKQGPCLGVKQITCPSDTHVKFNLFTKENSTGHQLNFLDPRTLSIFNSSNPTKILIHGFNLDSKASSIMDMKQAYLEMGPHNVITADWSALGTGPDFCSMLASKNTEFVGQCVADLISRLQNKTRDIHIIGQSLGARVAGYAANILKPFLLPRITGLDPAKPMFGKNDLLHKLDSTDASFVDIIHTNVLNKGKVETAGHVDFYVNGGIFQPGCSSDKKARLFGNVVCSHIRAANYFIESIKSPMGFWGWSCPTLSSAISGSCTPNSPAIVMGEPVSHWARGVVHVETRSKTPFSLGPWLMGSSNRPTNEHISRPNLGSGLEYYLDNNYHHHTSSPDHHHHYGGTPDNHQYYGSIPDHHYGNNLGNYYGSVPDHHHHYGNNPDNYYGSIPDHHHHYGNNPDDYYGSVPDHHQHYSNNPYVYYGSSPDYHHHYGQGWAI